METIYTEDPARLPQDDSAKGKSSQLKSSSRYAFSDPTCSMDPHSLGATSGNAWLVLG